MKSNLNDELIGLLHAISGLLQRSQHGAGLIHGPLHRGQVRLIRLLGEMDGAGQKELGERLGVRPASVSELLDRLEAAGLVVRSHNDKDKRVARVCLTAKGRETAVEAAELRRHVLQVVFGELSERECGQLARLLEKVVAGLEKSSVAASSPKTLGMALKRGEV